jgi:hypothetical protein
LASDVLPELELREIVLFDVGGRIAARRQLS